MKYDSLIHDFLHGVDLVNDVMNDIPNEYLDYVPKHNDSWTIRQHIIHLVDSDINNFIRIKSCISQAYSNCYVIEENDWVKNLGNKKEDIAEYMKVFSILRNILSCFLLTVDESEYTLKYFMRTYNNETSKIYLYDAIKNYIDHVKFHIEYINNIKKEYLTIAST